MYGQHISISGPFDSAVEKVTAAVTRPIHLREVLCFAAHS